MILEMKGHFKAIVFMFVITIVLLNPFSGFADDERIPKADVNDKEAVDDALQSSRGPQFTPKLVCNEPEPEPQTKQAYPMDLVTFNCTVTNEGNFYDDYVVDSTPIKGWNIILYPDKFPRIPPRSSPEDDAKKIRKMTVRIVVGDLYSAMVGKYALDVTLRSKLSSNRSTLTFNIDVLLLHRIDIKTPEAQYKLPGEDVLYEFQIQNLGNGDDIYDLWIDSSHGEWVALLVDDTQARLHIQMGRTVVIPVIVYLPAEADAGFSHITTLVAQPIDSDSGQKEMGFVQTIVTHIYDVDVVRDETLIPERDGQPGGYSTFTFTIINTGNDLDDMVGNPGTFVVSDSPNQPSQWETWLDSSNIREGGLPQDLEADIEFKIRVPPSTPVGKYKFTIDVLSDVPLKIQDTVEFTVNVIPIRNAEITCNVSSKVGFIGDNVSFVIMLRNIGNIEDTYTWEVECEYPDWVYIPEPQFTVDFGYTTEPIFYVKIPLDQAAKSYEFVLKLGSMVNVNISFQQTFSLTVAETLDFSFEESNRTYDAIPQGETLVKLKVHNTCNGDVTLSFDIFGEKWGLLGQKNLFLQYRESKEMALSFKPPTGVDLKGYTFEVQGWITVGAKLVKKTTINIRVVEFEFAVTDLYLENDIAKDIYMVEKNLPLGLYLDVLNKGAQFFDSEKFGSELWVNIRSGGELIYRTNITYMESNSYVRVKFNHTFSKPGDFLITSEISGIKDAYPENDKGEGYFSVIEHEIEVDENKTNEMGISSLDYVFIFLIIFLAFMITVFSVIFLKKKYNVESLVYDATADYDAEDDSFISDEMDIEDSSDDREMEEGKNMEYLNQLNRSRFEAQMQTMYGGMEGYGAPGFNGYPQQPFYPQQQQADYFIPPGTQPMMQDQFQPAAVGMQPGAPRIVSTTQALPQGPTAVDVTLPKTTSVPAGEVQMALPPASISPEEATKEGVDIQGLLSSIKRTAPIAGVAKTSPTPASGATPMVAKTSPVPVGATPMVAKTSPVPASGATPVIARTAPVSVSTTTPVVAKTAPLSSGTAPVIARTSPVISSPAPAITSPDKVENVADTTKKLEDILAKLRT